MADTSDPKAPLAENEEEEIGDPVPANIQAWTSLFGILAGILLMMGLTSSEWVYAVDDYYYQGLFIYCARGGFNETGSGSGSGSDSSSSSSSEELSFSVDDDFAEGCKRIDLDNQGYTMFAAFLASVALATIVFGTMLVLLGSWVQDIDSKRKVYRLSLYMMIVSIVTNFLSMVVYSVNFDDVADSDDDLGPFKDTENDWRFGWSFKICVVALFVQVATAMAIGYGLLLFPIIEEVVEEDEAAAAAGGDK